MNLRYILKKSEKLVVDNSPAILTALGVTGVVTTAYLTGKATLKASEIIAEQKEEAKKKRPAAPDNILLTRRDRFDLVWKLYIPAVSTGIVTIASIIGANHIGTRRAAAVAAAYSLSEKAWEEYRDRVVEKLGDKNEQHIRDEVAQKQVERNPVGDREVILTGDGDVLCYDSISGRYFESSVEALRKAQNDINHEIINNMYSNLYDFYQKIGLEPTPYSTEVGWNADTMLELNFSATLTDKGRPCMSVNYAVYPIRDYHLLH